MSHDNRTVQFSPFAALTGCEAEVAEAGQMTNCRIELSECEIAKLNERLYSSKDILYCADKFIRPSCITVPAQYS